MRALWLVPTATVAVAVSACGGGAGVPHTGAMTPTALLATPAPTPTPIPPTPTAAPPPSSAPAVAYAPQPAARSVRPAPPRYPLVDRLDASSVGVHVSVVAVGIVNGAMEAPEGPLGSPFWREGFWLRNGVVPGNPGVATIAGHLDDIGARPAAFWNIRNLVSGDEVSVTRLSDGAVLRYRIVETDVWTIAQASTATSLRRIYGDGTAGDGVARLTLITCTGRWNGSEYDHRFVAFAVLEQ